LGENIVRIGGVGGGLALWGCEAEDDPS